MKESTLMKIVKQLNDDHKFTDIEWKISCLESLVRRKLDPFYGLNEEEIRKASLCKPEVVKSGWKPPSLLSEQEAQEAINKLDANSWVELTRNSPVKYFDKHSFSLQYKKDGAWINIESNHIPPKDNPTTYLILEMICGVEYRSKPIPIDNMDISREFNIEIHKHWFDGITYEKGKAYYGGFRVGLIED